MQRSGQKQIPFGNDNQKGKGRGTGRSRFPSGMTTRKAKAWLLLWWLGG
jgi:hypothetical protein